MDVLCFLRGAFSPKYRCFFTLKYVRVSVFFDVCLYFWEFMSFLQGIYLFEMCAFSFEVCPFSLKYNRFLNRFPFPGG